MQKQKNYYLKAIELDNANAMYRFASYLKKIEKNNRECRKYLLMSANLYFTNATIKINELLKNKYNFEFALEAYEHLDERNLNKLNKFIHSYEKNKNMLSKNALVKITCTKCCVDHLNCVFLHCQHSICLECYGKEVKCRICK